MFLLGFPLLLIPFAIYNIIAFLLPGLGWDYEIAHVRMISGADWRLTLGDLLVALAILLLFVELMKSTRVATRTIVDHMLSMMLFAGMLVEFLLAQQAATAVFFLLLVIGFVDVAGGFTITIRTAQRDISFTGVGNVPPT
jgi:hypothetical protein